MDARSTAPSDESSDCSEAWPGPPPDAAWRWRAAYPLSVLLSECPLGSPQASISDPLWPRLSQKPLLARL